MYEFGVHSLARDRRRLQSRAKPGMTSTALVFYDCCRAGIAELLEADADLDVVQATIDAYALAPEEKDALWRWAMGRRLGSSDPGDASDDGWRRSPSPSVGEHDFSGRVGDKLAALRSKNLGACDACGRPTLLTQGLTVSPGRVATRAARSALEHHCRWRPPRTRWQQTAMLARHSARARGLGGDGMADRRLSEEPSADASPNGDAPLARITGPHQYVLGGGEDGDRTADDRDQRADAHDRASEARDERADVRDERARTREHSAGVVDAGAVADRVGALSDRRGGAGAAPRQEMIATQRHRDHAWP